MTPISNEDWDDILLDIKDQKAVLLIGPELMQIEGKPLNRHLRDSLHQRNPNDIAYYYERDGFFLFSSSKSKVRVGRQISRLYRDVMPDEAILQRIVQIPFHLIMSINPDTFLSEAFYRHGVKHRFHHFQYRQRDNGNDKMDMPTMALPLIYNLFGSKDQDDSLVLDYDDMYKMLQSALGEPGLPIKLRGKLREARTYIFLGFQFDKWYSQLLLKLLKDDSEQDKLISINNPLEDIDTHQFIIQQFDIKFMGDQFDFFGELYKRCDTENILRGISDDTLCAEAVAILKCVAIGEIDNALEALHNAARNKDWENEVIHLRARFTRLEDDKHKTDSRDYRTELAKILDSIIELTKNVCP